MKLLQLTLPFIALVLLSCEPIVHEMPDKKIYDDLKTVYNSESTFTKDAEYQELDEQFYDFLLNHSYSSYVDNATYYRGRLTQKWANRKTGLDKVEMYKRAVLIFRDIEFKSSYRDEALYQVAESLYSLFETGSEITAEEVVTAYREYIALSPNSSSADKAAMKIEELQQ